MAVSFTRAPTVATGDRISSAQLATLAQAFNDRLLSGLGDGTWRIWFLFQALFRQMRNPDGSAFPSQTEFLEYYATLDPLDATWPLAVAGDPQGANLSNPLNAWLFGSVPSGLDAEGDRINLVPTGTVGMSAVNAWDLAKDQRGGYDPGTGAISSNLLAAAEAHIRNWGSVYERSYGSWFRFEPVPVAVLFKPPAGMLARMLNTFVREFRGSTDQRSVSTYHLQEAFDFDWFFTKQYHLAPAKGVDDGLGNVVVTYPSFSTASSIGAGGTLGLRTWDASFSMTGWKILVSGLQDPVQLTVLAGATELGTVVLDPDESGNASGVYYLTTAAIAPANVRVRFDTALNLSAGSFFIEFTELVTSSPSIGDAYAFLRCASCDASNIPDGTGEQSDFAKTISDAYKTLGCIVNPNTSGAQPLSAEVNTAAVFDAIRRLSLCIRQSRRQQFTGYAVENGKSVLWFQRTFSVSGVEIEPLAPLLEIAHTAPVNGWTNEWVLDVELRPYDNDAASLFKPDAYTDYFSFINRCHFYSNQMLVDSELLRHISYNEPPLAPESPPGWIYATSRGSNLNTLDCAGDPTCEEYRLGFYKSCRIYEPPVEVESVEVVGSELKITLTGRLHHCDEAPESIARDIGTWDTAALAAEPWRSVENGLRQYLVQANGGVDCARPGGAFQSPAGNAAIDAPIFSDPGRPWGACFPVFRWTKLIPKPYADANDTQDSTDTHFVHDQFTLMELYLRAMCEGYVDGELTIEEACLADAATLYDYTFERLCLVAFGSPQMDLLPGYGDGHGPLPNTRALAATFNQFSAAVNLLTRVRVMLPARFQCNTSSVTVPIPVTGFAGDGSIVTPCSLSSDAWSEVGATSPAELDFPEENWVDCDGGIQGYLELRFGNCDGETWLVEAVTQGAKLRYAYNDEDFRWAIPESWRDQFEDSPGILVRENVCSVYLEREVTSDPEQAELCFQEPGEPFPAFPDGDGNYLRFRQIEGDASVCSPGTCRFMSGETPALPSGIPATAVAIAYNGFGDQCLQTPAPHFTRTVTAFVGQVPTLEVPLTG